MEGTRREKFLMVSLFLFILWAFLGCTDSPRHVINWKKQTEPTVGSVHSECAVVASAGPTRASNVPLYIYLKGHKGDQLRNETYIIVKNKSYSFVLEYRGRSQYKVLSAKPDTCDEEPDRDDILPDSEYLENAKPTRNMRHSSNLEVAFLFDKKKEV